MEECLGDLDLRLKADQNLCGSILLAIVNLFVFISISSSFSCFHAWEYRCLIIHARCAGAQPPRCGEMCGHGSETHTIACSTSQPCWVLATFVSISSWGICKERLFGAQLVTYYWCLVYIQLCLLTSSTAMHTTGFVLTSKSQFHPCRLATEWAMPASLWGVSERLPFISRVGWDPLSLCWCEKGEEFQCLLQWWVYKGADHDKHLLLHPRVGFMAWLNCNTSLLISVWFLSPPSGPTRNL